VIPEQLGIRAGHYVSSTASGGGRAQGSGRLLNELLYA